MWIRNLQLLLIAFSAAFLSVSFRYYGFPWQKIIADIIANEFFEKIEKFLFYDVSAHKIRTTFFAVFAPESGTGKDRKNI